MQSSGTPSMTPGQTRPKSPQCGPILPARTPPKSLAPVLAALSLPAESQGGLTGPLQGSWRGTARQGVLPQGGLRGGGPQGQCPVVPRRGYKGAIGAGPALQGLFRRLRGLEGGARLDSGAGDLGVRVWRGPPRWRRVRVWGRGWGCRRHCSHRRRCSRSSRPSCSSTWQMQRCALGLNRLIIEEHRLSGNLLN